MEIICGLCKNVLKDPQILPCQHSFCKQPCLIPFDTKINEVLCPLCYIEFPVTDLEPNSKLECIVRAYDKACKSAELVQCSVRSTRNTNLIDCDHCDQYNNENNSKSNFEFQTNMLVGKIANLKGQSDLLMTFKARKLQSSNTISECSKMELLAEKIDTVVQNLQIAVDRALDKAEDQILMIELADTQQLLSAAHQMPHLRETLSVLEEEIDYNCYVADIKEMVLFRNDVTTLWSDIESIDKIIADSSTRSLDSLMPSKVFSTIEGRLESTCFLTRIGIQDARLHSDHDSYTETPSSIQKNMSMGSFDGFVEASQSSSINLISDSMRVGNTTSIDLNLTATYRLSFTGMKQNVSKAMMTSYFQGFGPVVEVIQNVYNGKPNGQGYIEFENAKDAEDVLRCSPHVIGSSNIRVGICRSSDTDSTSNSMNLVSNSINVKNNISVDLNVTKTYRLSFRGMKQNLSKEMMTSYFEEFGLIARVKRNFFPGTDKTNGQGYIEFEYAQDAEDVLRSSPHVIDSSNIHVGIYRSSKRASKSNNMNLVENTTSVDLNASKIYRLSFTGMKQNVSKEMMTSYFQQFGPIAQFNRKCFSGTNKTNGTGYITFENAQDAEDVLRSSPHVINSSKIRLGICRSKS